MKRRKPDSFLDKTISTLTGKAKLERTETDPSSADIVNVLMEVIPEFHFITDQHTIGASGLSGHNTFHFFMTWGDEGVNSECLNTNLRTTPKRVLIPFALMYRIAEDRNELGLGPPHIEAQPELSAISQKQAREELYHPGKVIPFIGDGRLWLISEAKGEHNETLEFSLFRAV
jgi:hypothetical protein